MNVLTRQRTTEVSNGRGYFAECGLWNAESCQGVICRKSSAECFANYPLSLFRVTSYYPSKLISKINTLNRPSKGDDQIARHSCKHWYMPHDYPRVWATNTINLLPPLIVRINSWRHRRNRGGHWKLHWCWVVVCLGAVGSVTELQSDSMPAGSACDCH